MRILHITPFFYEGLNYQEESLAITQSEIGHDVFVIKPNYVSKNERLSSQSLKKDIKRRFSVIELNLIFNIRSRILFKDLYSAVKKISPDIIHCHCFLHPHTIQVCLISRLTKIPIVFDDHCSDFNTRINFFTKLMYKFIFYTVSLIYKRPRIILTAEDVQSFWKQVFNYLPPNQGLIRSGVSKFFSSNTPKIENERDTLNIIHIGANINERKGLERIFKSLDLIKNEKQILFRIVGNIQEDYMQKLRNTSEDYKNLTIQFTGLKSGNDLLESIIDFDIAFWPKDISISALLAMSQGSFLICESRGDYEKHLVSSGGGKTFPPGDFNKLASILNKLIEDKEYLLDGRQKARDFILENHTWESISEKFLQEYKREICIRSKS